MGPSIPIADEFAQCRALMEPKRVGFADLLAHDSVSACFHSLNAPSTLVCHPCLLDGSQFFPNDLAN